MQISTPTCEKARAARRTRRRVSSERALACDAPADRALSADTMDKWDQAKLDRVVLSKHGNTKSTTDKVCKFFLQAVEEGKYGWFW